MIRERHMRAMGDMATPISYTVVATHFEDLMKLI
jgi:hypothetical protein